MNLTGQRRRGNRPTYPHSCQHCGRDYFSEMKQSKYCSVACNGKARSIWQRGEGNPCWRNGRSKVHIYYRKRQLERWPERCAARAAVQKAIKTGKLTRLPCTVCGDPKSQGHHHNGYAREHWLDVVFLCRPCHRKAEAHMRVL